MKKSIKTKHKEIVDYWKDKIDESDLGCDFADMIEDDGVHGRCWRCSHRSRLKSLERCHIIPEQKPFLGEDKPSNFVILCGSCHIEAPDCSNSDIIFNWIKSTKFSIYGHYQADVVLDMYKKMFGNPVISNKIKKLPVEEIQKKVEKWLKKNSKNYGVNFSGHSTSTKALMVFDFLKEIGE